MSIQDVIAIGLAGGAFLVVVRFLWRSLHSGGCGAGCGCSKTSRTDATHGRLNPTGVKVVPLMRPDDIGRPSKTRTSDPRRS